MLRQAGNQAEALLWLELRAKKLGGHHFVRQFPIGAYFADFCCRKAKLVVEVDGSQHAENPRDRTRDAFLQAQGYSVLRFWNHDVLKHRRAVCETILAALDGRLAGSVTASDLRFAFTPPPDAAEESPSARARSLPLPSPGGEVAPRSGDGEGERRSPPPFRSMEPAP